MINNNYNNYIHYKNLCTTIVGGRRCSNFVNGPYSLKYSACGVVPMLKYNVDKKNYNVAIFFVSDIGKRRGMLDDAAGGVDKTDIDNNMLSHNVASRELFEESAGLLDLSNNSYLLKKSMNIYFDSFNPTKKNATDCLYISYFPFLEFDHINVQQYFRANRKKFLFKKRIFSKSSYPVKTEIHDVSRISPFVESNKIVMINVDTPIKYVNEKVYLADIFGDEYECYGKVTSLLIALKQKYGENKHNVLKYVFNDSINKKHIKVYKKNISVAAYISKTNELYKYGDKFTESNIISFA
jgi:predicted RNA-binding protein